MRTNSWLLDSSASPPAKRKCAVVRIRCLPSVGEAPFISRRLGAGLPGLILGMEAIEPSPADTAVKSNGRITGLTHGRNALTRPFKAWALFDLIVATYSRLVPAVYSWRSPRAARMKWVLF